MTRIKAVLWDMDGTLVDSEHVAVEALRRAMAEAGLPALPDLHDRVVGRAADDIYRWFVADYGLSLDPVEWERRKHHHHFAAVDQLKGFPAAIATFQELEKAGLGQAIVSNSDRTIMDLQLRLVGLSHPGRVSVSRNDIRKGKPDPEGYLRAAWLLDAEPSQCLVIEDSCSGIEAGVAAGMRTLLVPHTTISPVLEATLLRDMKEIIFMATGAE